MQIQNTSSPAFSCERERELFERARQGDGSAFDELMRPHMGAIRRYTSRYFSNYSVDDAEDAVQETLLKAWTNLRKFGGGSKFLTWLLGIATNESLHKLRSLRSKKETMFAASVCDEELERYLQRPGAAAAQDPQLLLEAKQFATKVDAELSALSDEFSVALQMFAIDDCTYSDISAALSCPVGTVKSRIARARQAARNALS